jgi:hypothetical protein
MDTLLHRLGLRLSFWSTADAHSEHKASDPAVCEPTQDQISYAHEIAEEERKRWMAHQRES